MKFRKNLNKIQFPNGEKNKIFKRLKNSVINSFNKYEKKDTFLKVQ